MSDLIAPAMFGALLLVLLLGYPVAFSLAAIAGVFGVSGVILGAFDTPFLLAMVFRIQGIFNNDNLLAIPMLIFMGVLLEKMGFAEDMFRALNRMLGRFSGGIAYGTILVGAVLSSLTGFVSASVIAIGLIGLPAMIRANYDPKLATGVVAASGTLAQIIPPSLVLIVLSEQLEVSLQAIFRGAVVPSAMLIGLYCLYVFLVTLRHPKIAPPGVAGLASEHPPSPLWREIAVAIGLPIILIGLVLASIFFGVATPSEGGGDRRDGDATACDEPR